MSVPPSTSVPAPVQAAAGEILKVDVQPDTWDKIAALAPALALLAVLATIWATRTDNDTRWRRERELEARKWEVLQRREAYAENIAATLAYFSSLSGAVEFVAGGGGQLPREAAQEIEQTFLRYTRSFSVAHIVGSEDYVDLLEEVSELDVALDAALQSGSPESCKKALELPQEMLLQLTALARAELSSLWPSGEADEESLPDSKHG